MIRFSKGKQPFRVATLNMKVFQFVLSCHLLALPHVGLEATGEASSKEIAFIHPSLGCCGGNAKPCLTWYVCLLPAARACLPTSVCTAHVEVDLLPPSPTRPQGIVQASRYTCSNPSAGASNWEAKRLFQALHCLARYQQSMLQIGLAALLTALSMLLFDRDHKDLWGLQDQM